jgi:hypothetical protein
VRCGSRGIAWCLAMNPARSAALGPPSLLLSVRSCSGFGLARRGPGVGDRSCWIPCIYLQLYIEKQTLTRVKPETCTANKENTTHGHCGHGHGHGHCATASRRVSPHHDTALGPARSVRTRLHTAAVYSVVGPCAGQQPGFLTAIMITCPSQCCQW